MKNKFFAVICVAAIVLSLAACSSGGEVQLTHYTIDASLSDGHVLTATVTCDYVNNTDVPLGELWFHLYPNAYRSGAKYTAVAEGDFNAAFPNGRSYSELDVSAVTVNGAGADATVTGEDSDILAVPLSSPLDPTERSSVEISYTLKLPNAGHRLGYTDRSVNLANFYPIVCVYRGGAFVADPYYSTGDPFFSECADYTVSLTVPEEMTGAFTGVIKGRTAAGGRVTYDVEAKSVRDFAAVLGGYSKLSGLAGSTIVNYMYYKDAVPERALNTAIDAVNTFGELFGEYPYPEYTVVQTSFLHGGMEYPCLSMISDKYTGDAYNDIVVHETAHQWWYAAVGNDEVKYPWLDEGLAEYSTMLFYEHNTDGYAYTFNGKRADALSAYILYCETYKNNGLGDTSMTRAVNEYDNDTEYSYMSYVKGALMLDDVRNSIGSAAFFAGLKDYYRTYMYKNAQPEDLIGAMERASKRRLDALFSSWLDGHVKLYSAS